MTAEIAPSVPDAENGGAGHPTTITEYDRNSNITGVVDPRGVRTEYGYDALNRRTTEIRAAGSGEAVSISTGYDGNNNVTSLTLHNILPGNVAQDQITTYAYDDYDRKIGEVRPQARTATWTHDEIGNVLSETDPKGQFIAHCYDVANRRIGTTFYDAVNGTITETRSFGHDKVGNLTSAHDNTGSSTYTYDDGYRLTGESRSPSLPGAVPYTVVSGYDANGNRTGCTFPETGRALGSEYDARNLLVTLTDIHNGVVKTTVYGLDPNGNRTSCELPNGDESAYTYDAANRFETYTSENSAGNLIYDVDYGRFPNFSTHILSHVQPRVTIYLISET
ncbi:MAG: hypothetical protein AAF492_33145, partial [Verrucomicrobiota bacterium]